MGIVYRKEDKFSQKQAGKTVTWGAGNGTPKAAVAYINNKPYEIKENETIISFIRRYKRLVH